MKKGREVVKGRIEGSKVSQGKTKERAGGPITYYITNTVFINTM